ncbi:MAG: DUF4272 domain-containing protein [Pirellulales bacterium]
MLDVGKRGFFRKAKPLTFNHDSKYYEGDDWPAQTEGMREYFSRFPDVPRKSEILDVIGSFRFALSVPQHDLNIESDDERLALVYAVCRHLDGVVFTPSALRDAQGRILIEAGGGYDPTAVLPSVPNLKVAAEVEGNDLDDDESEPVPPTPERVGKRALALTAVAARATLELDAPELDDPEAERRRLLAWVATLGIDDELEPDEWKVLQRSTGKLEERDFINAMWRVEGLVVLAWALRRFEIPPDDKLVIPFDLYCAMGIYETENARERLASVEPRSVEELTEMQTHLLMLHWRIRNYRLRPGRMDFVEFSKTCWFCKFDIQRFRIIDSDLAIGDVAINDSNDVERGKIASLALERHLAINWLMGYAQKYSVTDTST